VRCSCAARTARTPTKSTQCVCPESTGGITRHPHFPPKTRLWHVNKRPPCLQINPPCTIAQEQPHIATWWEAPDRLLVGHWAWANAHAPSASRSHNCLPLSHQGSAPTQHTYGLTASGPTSRPTVLEGPKGWGRGMRLVAGKHVQTTGVPGTTHGSVPTLTAEQKSGAQNSTPPPRFAGSAKLYQMRQVWLAETTCAA
jgi:hypothetical protein